MVESSGLETTIWFRRGKLTGNAGIDHLNIPPKHLKILIWFLQRVQLLKYTVKFGSSAEELISTEQTLRWRVKHGIYKFRNIAEELDIHWTNFKGNGLNIEYTSSGIQLKKLISTEQTLKWRVKHWMYKFRNIAKELDIHWTNFKGDGLNFWNIQVQKFRLISSIQTKVTGQTINYWNET